MLDSFMNRQAKRHKNIAILMCKKTLRMMGAGSHAYNPSTYIMLVPQPVGTKFNRSQVNRGRYVKSIMQATKEEMS